MSSKEQIKVYPNIGSVSYKRNLRARRLSIRIKRSGEVKVTIPSVLSFSAAENFVLSKANWIVEKVLEFETKKQNLIPDGFKTRHHTIKFSNHIQPNVKIKYSKPIINILHPSTHSETNEQIQSVAKKAVELAYRVEAKEYLPARLEQLAFQNGFKYSKLTIRNSTTRWGSCSSKNSISLSLHLMKLPDELIDYILLHELCHTVHKNHGPKFWELLDVKSGGKAKFYAKEVRKYSTQI